MSEMNVSTTVAQTQEFITAKVEEHGFAILSGKAPNPTAVNHYAYTVGLSLQGWPELYIEGPLKHEQLGMILQRQIERFSDRGVDYDPTDGIVPGAQGRSVRSQVVEVIAPELIDSRCEYLRWWRDTHSDQGIAMAQVLWADVNNVLPNEEGHTHEDNQHEWPVAIGVTWNDQLLSKADHTIMEEGAGYLYVNGAAILASYQNLSSADRELYIEQPPLDVWGDVLGDQLHPLLIQQALTYFSVHPEYEFELEDHLVVGGQFYQQLNDTRAAFRLQGTRFVAEHFEGGNESPIFTVTETTVEDVAHKVRVLQVLKADTVNPRGTFVFFKFDESLGTGLGLAELEGFDVVEFKHELLDQIIQAFSVKAEGLFEGILGVFKLNVYTAGNLVQLHGTDALYMNQQNVLLEATVGEDGQLTLAQHGLYPVLVKEQYPLYLKFIEHLKS